MVKNNKIQFIHNKQVAGLIFIGPWLLGFFGFIIIPIFISLYLSFTSYNLISPPQWIGLKNFIRMFTKDNTFLTSLIVTLKFVLFSVPFRLIFALAIAMILSQKRKLVTLYRIIYYIPSILGGSVAVSIVWRMIFGSRGPLSALIKIVTGSSYSLIGDPDGALSSIVLLSMWQFGSSMLIFLAGLKNISPTYYEAAVIDGAGSMRKFFHITLPLLSPVILFNLIMQTIGGFKMFTQAYIVTEGGPMSKTLVYALYLFKRAFTFNEMGYASAMAWFLLIIIAIITGLFFKSSKRWVFYEGGNK
ncbi:MAG: sugar ABC transporter permease [Spirochaetaceae bacterium]